MTDAVATTDDATYSERAKPPEPSRAARFGVLCLCVTALVGVGAPLAGHRVFLGADLLRVYAPWHTHETATARQHLVFSDTVDFYTPQRIDAAQRLRDGELPWWNPYPAGGTPLASVPDTAVFSPLNLPWLVLPGWLAPAYNALVGLIVAALGMFLFLRRLSVSKVAAVIGGAAYMTTGFMASWTGWPHAHVAALVPMLFWAVERALQRATWRAAVPIALVLATMWAEGFPAVTGFAIYSAAGYTLIRLLATLPRPIVADRLRPLLRVRVRLGAVVGAGIALGTSLLAFQLLPFVARLSTVDIESRVQRPTLHLALPSIATIALPYAFGSPEAGSTGAGNYFGPHNLIEINGFVGAAMLVGVIALLAWRRPRRVPPGVCTALTTIVVITAIAVYHGGALLGFLQKFPVFSNNPVRRMTSILDFALPALGALGIDRVISDRDELGNVARWRVVGAWLLGGVAGVGVLAKVLSLAGPSGHRGWVAEHALIPTASALLASAVLWLAVRSARNVRFVRIVIPALVMVEGLAFVLPWWPTSARSDFYPATATHTFLSQHIGADRYAAEGGTMLQSSNTYYKLRAVTAHAFRQPSWFDLVKAIDPTVKQGATQMFLGENLASLPSPVLDRLAARYFVADPVRPIPGTTVPPATSASPTTIELGSGRTLVGTPVSGDGALRAIVLPIARAVPSSGARLRRIHVVALAGSRVVASAWRNLNDGWPAMNLAIAIPEPTGSAGADPVTSVRLSLEGAGPILLGAGGDGHVSLGRISDPDDGARVVLAADSVVYERTHALARVRWMPRSRVIGEPKARINALVSGQVPLDTVVLSSGRGVAAGSGLAPRSFRVTKDDPEHIRVEVDAKGAGFVEVADAIQHGWTATVDGHAAVLREADNAVVAVTVTAGHHVIDVRYQPTGQRSGFAVSLLAFAALVALIVTPRVRARRRRGATSV